MLMCQFPIDDFKEMLLELKNHQRVKRGAVLLGDLEAIARFLKENSYEVEDIDIDDLDISELL